MLADSTHAALLCSLRITNVTPSPTWTVPQVGYGFSRRLAQSGLSSNKVAIWVSVKFTGTTEPVLTAVNMIKADPCNINGFCSTMDTVKVVHVTGDPIKSTNLALTLESYTPGSLRFKTSLIENGVKFPDVPVLLRSDRTDTNLA